MRAEKEVPPALRLERAHVQVVPQLPDRVDADLVTERLEDGHGGRGPTPALAGRAQPRAARRRRPWWRGGPPQKRRSPSPTPRAETAGASAPFPPPAGP